MRNPARKAESSNGGCLPAGLLNNLLHWKSRSERWLPYHLHVEKCKVCTDRLFQIQKARDRHLYQVPKIQDAQEELLEWLFLSRC
ncbi:MAG: hypothetical protein HY652_12595 [Acidobacteria bacterium]|nr:hypothetical protein [Acidobacteriota bacterium]